MRLKPHHRPKLSSILDRIRPCRFPVTPAMTPPALPNVSTGEDVDAVAMEQQQCWSRHIFRVERRRMPLLCKFNLSPCVSWKVKIVAPVVRTAWNASSRPFPSRSKIPFKFWLYIRSIEVSSSVSGVLW